MSEPRSGQTPCRSGRGQPCSLARSAALSLGLLQAQKRKKEAARQERLAAEEAAREEVCL